MYLNGNLGIIQTLSGQGGQIPDRFWNKYSGRFCIENIFYTFSEHFSALRIEKDKKLYKFWTFKSLKKNPDSMFGQYLGQKINIFRTYIPGHFR